MIARADCIQSGIRRYGTVQHVALCYSSKWMHGGVGPRGKEYQRTCTMMHPCSKHLQCMKLLATFLVVKVIVSSAAILQCHNAIVCSHRGTPGAIVLGSVRITFAYPLHPCYRNMQSIASFHQPLRVPNSCVHVGMHA